LAVSSAAFSRSSFIRRGSLAVGFRPRFFGVNPCSRWREPRDFLGKVAKLLGIPLKPLPSDEDD
jgi:hypothetical protein